MSTSTPSTRERPDAVATSQKLASDALGTVTAAVRALAFWLTIPLPAVLVVTLVSGLVASAPLAVAGLVGLNVACAVVGRNHSPEA
ncbi:hypothetical protein [Haloarcula salina]|uniref:Uncharacterized protein n=1 Tax=Haloarcula salina TaxID=1429914 RepID=A0AA41KJ70_9EURY|nr:hypothetical protein [Haloarcula salina]MBV0903566.1 hypothetical protein [Haloarcula salina]